MQSLTNLEEKVLRMRLGLAGRALEDLTEVEAEGALFEKLMALEGQLLAGKSIREATVAVDAPVRPARAPRRRRH